MTIYLVQNNQKITLAAFKQKRKANSFAKHIGGFRWEEKWTIEEMKLDSPDAWILNGNTSYKAAKARLGKNNGRKD